jgi:hypothetical protein
MAASQCRSHPSFPHGFSGNPADSDGFLILMSAHSAGATN